MNIKIIEENNEYFIEDEVLRDENISKAIKCIPHLHKTFGHTDFWVCLADIAENKEAVAVILSETGYLFFHSLRGVDGKMEEPFCIELDRVSDGKYRITKDIDIALREYNNIRKYELVDKLTK